MPYYEHATQPYYCPRCRAWFVPGNMSCLVAHPPGTCCHYGERPVGAPSDNERGEGRE